MRSGRTPNANLQDRHAMPAEFGELLIRNHELSVSGVRSEAAFAIRLQDSGCGVVESRLLVAASTWRCARSRRAKRPAQGVTRSKIPWNSGLSHCGGIGNPVIHSPLRISSHCRIRQKTCCQTARIPLFIPAIAPDWCMGKRVLPYKCIRTTVQNRTTKIGGTK